jgi:antibiotic biosynthesis monooxygenase (ABM) superfamily enzyme
MKRSVSCVLWLVASHLCLEWDESARRSGKKAGALLLQRESRGMKPSWRSALIVWVAIYPTLTLLQLVMGDVLRKLPLPLATLVSTAILVPLMVFLLIPAASKLLGPWLGLPVPDRDAPRR